MSKAKNKAPSAKEEAAEWRRLFDELTPAERREVLYLSLELKQKAQDRKENGQE